MLSIRDLY